MPNDTPRPEATFPLNGNVVIKINGVEYSETIPQSVGALFIAQNIKRRELFSPFDDFGLINKIILLNDIEIIDTNKSNDTDIFISGSNLRCPIKVACYIYFIVTENIIPTPYSKEIVKQFLTRLEYQESSHYDDFKQIVNEWQSYGTVKNVPISIDGIVIP